MTGLGALITPLTRSLAAGLFRGTYDPSPRAHECECTKHSGRTRTWGDNLMKVIRNLDQLCTYTRAKEKTLEALARKVYRDTISGATLSGIAPGTKEIGKRKAHIRVWGSLSLLGLVIHTISINGRRVFNFGRFSGDMTKREGVVDKTVPKEVLDYLWAERNSLTYRTSVDAQKALIACRARGGNGKGFTVRQVRNGLAVSFDLDLPMSLTHQGGVALAAIVEGTEKTTETLELLFPFTTDRWEEAVERIEAQAQAIRMEVHAICPNCQGLPVAI